MTARKIVHKRSSTGEDTQPKFIAPKPKETGGVIITYQESEIPYFRNTTPKREVTLSAPSQRTEEVEIDDNCITGITMDGTALTVFNHVAIINTGPIMSNYYTKTQVDVFFESTGFEKVTRQDYENMRQSGTLDNNKLYIIKD